MDITKLQRKRTSQEQLGKRSGARNVDNGLQAEQEEDEDGSTR